MLLKIAPLLPLLHGVVASHHKMSCCVVTQYIANHCRQATLFSELVAADDRFTVTRVALGLVCFRVKSVSRASSVVEGVVVAAVVACCS